VSSLWDVLNVALAYSRARTRRANFVGKKTDPPRAFEARRRSRLWRDTPPQYRGLGRSRPLYSWRSSFAIYHLSCACWLSPCDSRIIPDSLNLCPQFDLRIPKKSICTDSTLQMVNRSPISMSTILKCDEYELMISLDRADRKFQP
jgi:hypothetical protein